MSFSFLSSFYHSCGDITISNERMHTYVQCSWPLSSEGSCACFSSPHYDTPVLLSFCSGSVDNLLQPSYDIWPCQANTVTSVPPLSEGLPYAGLSLSLIAYEWGETFVMLHILWHRAQFSSSHQRYTPFNLLLRPAMGSGDLSVAKIHTQMHREHYPRHVMLI